MELNKITDNLKSYLQSTQSENEVEVVIELNPITSAGIPENIGRKEKIVNLKKIFHHDLQPVAKEISKHGGNIIDSVWLNQTIKATVSTKCIEELAKLKEVNAIDLPNRITKD